MIKQHAHIGLVVLLFVGTFVWAPVAHGNTFTLYTVEGFVSHLISIGIIPDSQAERARELGKLITQVDGPEFDAPGARNADKVSVRVSQLIQHANLEFDSSEDVEGLLLLVENTTSKAITLEAKRQCQVVYRIYDADESLLYDSSVTEQCQTKETVTYVLDAGKTRLFEVTHSQKTHQLESGTYTFELEYPGYGSGERLVTIL